MSAEFESWRSHRESILQYPRETKHVSLRLRKKNKILWAGKSQTLEMSGSQKKVRVPHFLMGLRRHHSILVTAGCEGVSVVQVQHYQAVIVTYSIP